VHLTRLTAEEAATWLLAHVRLVQCALAEGLLDLRADRVEVDADREQRVGVRLAQRVGARTHLRPHVGAYLLGIDPRVA
jgi:hypothetical protein